MYSCYPFAADSWLPPARVSLARDVVRLGKDADNSVQPCCLSDSWLQLSVKTASPTPSSCKQSNQYPNEQSSAQRLAVTSFLARAHMPNTRPVGCICKPGKNPLWQPIMSPLLTGYQCRSKTSAGKPRISTYHAFHQSCHLFGFQGPVFGIQSI